LGLPTPNGSQQWQALQVKRVIDRIQLPPYFSPIFRKENNILYLKIKEDFMQALTDNVNKTPDASPVLTKSVTRAADYLGISRTNMTKILGLSPASISRLYRGEYQLSQERKEWEFALLLIRVFRSLDSIVGEQSTAQKWLKSENISLRGRPIELICKIEGLVRVSQYLDANRGVI
jgi:hypothetical protein